MPSFFKRPSRIPLRTKENAEYKANKSTLKAEIKHLKKQYNNLLPSYTTYFPICEFSLYFPPTRSYEQYDTPAIREHRERIGAQINEKYRELDNLKHSSPNLTIQ